MSLCGVGDELCTPGKAKEFGDLRYSFINVVDEISLKLLTNNNKTTIIGT